MPSGMQDASDRTKLDSARQTRKRRRRERAQAQRDATIFAAPRSVFIAKPTPERPVRPSPDTQERIDQAKGMPRTRVRKPRKQDIDRAFELALGRPVHFDVAHQPRTITDAAPRGTLEERRRLGVPKLTEGGAPLVDLDSTLEKIHGAASDVGQTFGDMLRGVGVVSATGGDPRNVQSIAGRRQAQMGIDPTQAIEPAAQFVQNLAQGGTEAALGFVPGTVKLILDPGETGAAMWEDIKQRYAPLVNGDFNKLARQFYENPAPYLIDLYGVANAPGILARIARRKRAIPEGTIKAEGGEVRRQVSEAPVTAALQQGVARLGEAAPDAPIIGANRRARRLLRNEHEVELERRMHPVNEFMRKALPVSRSPFRKMAYDRVARYGGSIPDAIAAIGQEIAFRQRAGGSRNLSLIVQLRGAKRVLERGDRKVLALVDAGREITHRAEQSLINAGLLTEETAADRLSLPIKAIQEIPEITSPVRDQFRARLAELPEFKSPELLDAAMDVLDSSAHSWAQRTGENPATYYERFLGISHELPDALPEEIRPLYQGATPLETPPMPARLDVTPIAAAVREQKLPAELRKAGALEDLIPRLYEMAKEGAPYRDWYTRYANVMTKTAAELGVPPRQFAQLVAVYSQRANPTENFRRALMSVKNGGDFEVFAGQRAKAQKIMADPNWFEREYLPSQKGPKISNYYANALEDIDPRAYAELFGDRPAPVTIDTHMNVAMLGKDRVSDAHYESMAEVFRGMAAQMGWSPKEVQAAVWVVQKSRNEADRVLAKGKTAKDYPEYMPSSGDAYERAYGKYKGTLFQDDEKGAYQRDIDDAAGDDLSGLPTIQGIKYRSNAEAQELATSYMEAHGLPYNPPHTYAKVDPERAKRIAAWYDQAQHAPDDPAVRAAYDAMARETLAQYQTIIDAGYEFEFYPGHDPYPNGPRQAMDDLRDNKHLYVFPTDEGFGTEAVETQHPLLEQSGVVWGDKPATHNDVFRAVHDFFGHFKEGVGFRADGEENAWRSHSAMYSDEARPAMTAETRGQNSWVNFGPHGEKNRTANQMETVYADQKAVLAPDWVVREGAGDAVSGLSRDRELMAAGIQNDLEYNPIRLYQSDLGGFHNAAAEELAAHAELARDVARTLPEDEWPAWVRNQIRTQAVGRDEPIRIPPAELAPDTFPEDWLLGQRGRRSFTGERAAPRGAVSFEGERGTIHVGEKSEISTVAHEAAHVARRAFWDVLEDTDKNLIEASLGVRNGRWTRAKEEAFARLVELTWREGRAPTPQLRRTFRRVRRRMLEIYRSPKSIDKHLAENASPELKRVVRSLLDPTYGKTAGEGAFFIPDTAKRAIAPIGRGKNPLSKNRERLYENRGILFESGKLRTGPKLTGEHASRATRIEHQVELAREIDRRFAKPVTEDGIEPGHVLFNPEGHKVPRGLKEMDEPAEFAQKLEGLDPDEVQGLMQSELDALRESFFPKATPKELEGLKQVPEWVQQAFTEEMAFHIPSYSIARAAGKLFDLSNNIARLGIIYLNPAYIPINFAANELLAIIQQGVWHPLNLARATGLLGDLPVELRHRLDIEVGSGGAVAFNEAPGRVSQVASAVANVLNRGADVLPRRTAIMHELWKYGYRTEEQIRALLDDPSQRDRLGQIAQRAEEAMVRFRGLSPDEKKILARGIFIYRWLKGSTRYAARFPLEHPLLAPAAYEVGQQGYDWLEELRGDVIARWARTKLPIGKAEKTKLGHLMMKSLDLTAVSPFTTSVDAWESVWGSTTGQGVVRLANLFSPPLEAGTQIALGYDEQGNESTPGQIIENQAMSLRPIRTVSGLISPPGETRYSPAKSRKQVALEALGGSMAPKTYKLDELQKKGLEELPTVKRWLKKMERGEDGYTRFQVTGKIVDRELKKKYRYDETKRKLLHNVAAYIRGSQFVGEEPSLEDLNADLEGFAEPISQKDWDFVVALIERARSTVG